MIRAERPQQTGLVGPKENVVNDNSEKTMLATAFGVMFQAANVVAAPMPTLDATTARELAVLSRVLEHRLREARKRMKRALGRNAHLSLPDTRTIRVPKPVQTLDSTEECLAAL